MQSVEPRIDAAVFDVLGVENSVKSRTSYGGTAPDNVRKQARRWLERLGEPANEKVLIMHHMSKYDGLARRPCVIVRDIIA